MTHTRMHLGAVALAATLVVSNVFAAPATPAAGAVTICHFPPGDTNNPQVLTLGAPAAAKHLMQHPQDGVVGQDYDARCQQLPAAAITDFTLTTPFVGIVNVSWIVTVERGVSAYIIDRKLQASATFDLGVQASFPFGEQMEHNISDNPPGPGTYTYRLRVVFEDGTSATLAEGDVTL